MTAIDTATAWINQYASLVSATYADGYASLSARLPDGRVLSAHAGPGKDALARAAWELSASVRWACNARTPQVMLRSEVVIGLNHTWPESPAVMVQSGYGDVGTVSYRKAA